MDENKLEANLTRITCEAAALRDKGSDINIAPEIYMHRSSSTEPWTLPRSPYRHGESDGDVMLRLEQEFGAEINGFECVNLQFDDRGAEAFSSKIFVVLLAEDPQIDENHLWFKTDELPLFMMKLQFEKVIPAAVAYYKHRVLK